MQRWRIISQMLMSGIGVGGKVGIIGGAVYGFLYPFLPTLLTSPTTLDLPPSLFIIIIAVLVGGSAGLIYGSLLGALVGVSMGMLTWWVTPLDSPRLYHIVTQVGASVVTASGFLILLLYRFSPLPFFILSVAFVQNIGIPLLIASVSAGITAPHITAWYVNEQQRSR